MTATDTSLLEDMKTLVESSLLGDPESPLLWTTQSLRLLAGHLQAKGHKIGHVTVGALLAEQGYSWGCKVAPYGIYDLKHNEAWVNIGTDHDTSAFAVESIWRWWFMMGKERCPEATRLMITADSGGSNGARVRLWKAELQKFANETGLEIQVSHFPPGTSNR